MKQFFLMSLLLGLTFTRNIFGAPDPIRVSVVNFDNKSSYSGDDDCIGWSWFRNSPGEAMEEMLIGELKKDERLKVLERANIRKIYDNEFELVNSHKTKKKKRGMFETSDFTIAGTVSDFEWCNSKNGVGLNVGALVGFGDLTVSAKKSKALVRVDMRLIDVETGEVLATVIGEGTASTTKLGMDGFVKNVDFGGSTFKKTPLAEAMRDAIHQGASALIDKMTDQRRK